MVASHGNVESLIGRISTSFYKSYRAKGNMRWIIVLFTTGRFTGMAGNTVIGIKIKTVLFITIGVVTDFAIAIDIQTLAIKRITFRDCFNRCVVTVMGPAFGIIQQGIIGFIVTHFKHLYSSEITHFHTQAGRLLLIGKSFNADCRLFIGRLARIRIKQA